MKYRIKVTTYEGGRKDYVGQVRKWWGWASINSDGDAVMFDPFDMCYSQDLKWVQRNIKFHFDEHPRKLSVDKSAVNPLDLN